jgi:hypothetical protein
MYVRRPKSASISFESQFSGRGATEAQNRRGQRHFLAEVHIKVFRRPHELQNKDIIGKITNLFCIYLFQIDKFIDTH